MRYSATHKEETRTKLLESSGNIAKTGGFDSTGIDALMAALGLTGGAFYSHFSSKQDLFAALVEREIDRSAKMLAGTPDSPSDHVSKCVRSYLSTFHAEHPESGCVLVALGAEIARSSPEVRAGVEQSLKQVQSAWTGRLGGDKGKAWAVMAQLIGALVLARVVESPRTRQQILTSSRSAVQEMTLNSPPLG